MDSQKEKKAWREVKYSQKFLNAFRGMYIVWKTTRHLFIHIIAALVVIFLGFYFHISGMDCFDFRYRFCDNLRGI